MNTQLSPDPSSQRRSALHELELGGRRVSLVQPLVMGIVNVTPDSFSDGGVYLSAESAVTRALEMVPQGAGIIDIGGESSRPGAASVSSEDELARVIPVIRGIRAKSDTPISIDTYKGTVARQALAAGADIVNDISALRSDPEMVKVAAECSAPLILMHMLGTPQTMQQNPHYENCVEEIAAFFGERIAFCEAHGIARERLILDPGIGFGKRLEDNLAILAGLRRLTEFGLPVLVGASRKSFIGMLHQSGGAARDRLGGSIAAALLAVQRGATIVRVHDVAETVEALAVFRAIGEK